MEHWISHELHNTKAWFTLVTEAMKEESESEYDGSRNRSLAFIPNGRRPPCFLFLILHKGIGNELCDWLILLLELLILIKVIPLFCSVQLYCAQWKNKIFMFICS